MNTIVDFNESNKFVQTEMLFSDFFLSIPLMIRWRINWIRYYYVQKASGQYLTSRKRLAQSMFGKGKYCFHGPKKSSSETLLLKEERCDSLHWI